MGPNNAGKSNIFRMVSFISEALRSSSIVNRPLAYYHKHDLNAPFEIELSLQFTAEEANALADSLACSEFMNQINQLPSMGLTGPLPNIEPLKRAALDLYGRAVFTSLFQADFSIVVTAEKSEFYNPRTWFRIRSENKEAYIHDFGRITTSRVRPQGFARISPAEQLITELAQKYTEIRNYLKGPASETPALPQEFVPSSLIHWLFYPTSSESVPTGFDSQRWSGSQLEPSFSRTNTYQTLRTFYHSKGASFESTIGLFDTLRLIFLSTVILVSDVRGSSQKHYLENLETDEFPLHELTSDRLPSVLFKFKNSELVIERSRIDAISKTFSDLTDGLEFDAIIRTNVERVQQPPQMVVFPKAGTDFGSVQSADESLLGIRSGSGERKVHELSIEIGKDSQTYPLELSAAGISDSLLLATSIGSTSESAIFLDEPAQKMHPNLQSRFLDAIQKSITLNRNQFFLTTHSPYLVRASNMAHVWRFDRRNETTKTQNVGEALHHLERNDRTKIEIALKSADIRALLFSRGVVLVEGPSDKLVVERAANYLATIGKSADLVTREWSVVEVGGKDSFPSFFRICKILTLPRVVVADYDALMHLHSNPSGLPEKLAHSSPIFRALNLSGELNQEETLIIESESKNISSNETGHWYKPGLFEKLTNIARSHKVFIFRKNLEDAMQIQLKSNDRKPLRDIDEVITQIEAGKLSEELSDMGDFLKQTVDCQQ